MYCGCVCARQAWNFTSDKTSGYLSESTPISRCGGSTVTVDLVNERGEAVVSGLGRRARRRLVLTLVCMAVVLCGATADASFVKGGLWAPNRRFAFTMAAVRNTTSSGMRDMGHPHPEFAQLWDQKLGSDCRHVALDLMGSTGDKALPSKFATSVTMCVVRRFRTRRCRCPALLTRLCPHRKRVSRPETVHLDPLQRSLGAACRRYLQVSWP